MLFYFMYTAVKSSRATVAHIKLRAVKFAERRHVLDREGWFIYVGYSERPASRAVVIQHSVDFGLRSDLFCSAVSISS